MKASQQFVKKPHQNFPGNEKAKDVAEENERYKARMSYLEKACTTDTMHLVFASVQEKGRKSIRGYAYLKIPARQFLRSLSERHRKNPEIFIENGVSKISVNFPVMKTDKFQPKLPMKWTKVYTALTTKTKYSKAFYFAPLETLQMVDSVIDQMTKEGFYQVIYIKNGLFGPF